MRDDIHIIDMHCHVIPGVDDGAQSIEESIQLIRLAYEQGVRSLIATPHYSRSSPDRSRHAVQSALREELERRVQAEIDPEFRIWLGQEGNYHEEIVERIRDDFGWTMAGSRYMLTEFPVTAEYETIFRGLRKLLHAGFTPILAHIERFPSIRRKGGIEELRSMGVYMQMNYESLDGSFLNREVRWCRAQVRDGMIDLLGTDMHRPDFRPPHIRGAWDWMQGHLDADEIARLTYVNPQHIVRDEDLE